MKSGFVKIPVEQRCCQIGDNRFYFLIIVWDHVNCGPATQLLGYFSYSLDVLEQLFGGNFLQLKFIFSRFSIAGLANRPRPGSRRLRGDQSSSETRMKRDHGIDGKPNFGDKVGDQRCRHLNTEQNKAENFRLNETEFAKRSQSGARAASLAILPIFCAGSQANGTTGMVGEHSESVSVCFFCSII